MVKTHWLVRPLSRSVTKYVTRVAPRGKNAPDLELQLIDVMLAGKSLTKGEANLAAALVKPLAAATSMLGGHVMEGATATVVVVVAAVVDGVNGLIKGGGVEGGETITGTAKAPAMSKANRRIAEEGMALIHTTRTQTHFQ